MSEKDFLTIKKYISLQEATKFCNYSQEYLSLRARQGKLKSVKLGRNWLTTKEWLEEYLQHNGNGEPVATFVASRVEPFDMAQGKPPENLPVESDESKISEIRNYLPRVRHPREVYACGFRKSINLLRGISLKPWVPRDAFIFSLVFILILAGGIFGKESFISAYKDFSPVFSFISQTSDKINREADYRFEKISKNILAVSEGVREISMAVLEKIGSQEILISNQYVSVGLILKNTFGTFGDYGFWADERISVFAKKIKDGPVGRIYSRTCQSASKFAKKNIQTLNGKLANANKFAEENILVLDKKLAKANNFWEKKISKASDEISGKISKTVKGGYSIAIKSISNFLGRTYRFFADSFARVLKFANAPLRKILPGRGFFVNKEDFDALKLEMENLKREPVVIKRIEVEKVVEPVKEITRQLETVKQITKIDDLALADVRATLSYLEDEISKRLYAPGGVISQTIRLIEPVQSPKIYQENGEIVLQTLGSGNVILSAATGLQLYGSQVVIESTSKLSPMIYLANHSRIGGDLAVTGATSISGGVSMGGAASVSGNLTVGGDISVAGAQNFSGVTSISASSTSAVLTVAQTGTGDILNLKDGATEVFTVTDGGNVGIGTTTPSYLFSVQGQGFLSATTTIASDLVVAGAMKNVASKIVAATSTPNFTARADYVCTGASCEDEIQAAIDAVYNNGGGGTVYLLEGTFNTASPINVATNTALIGQGWSTIISGDGSGMTNIIVVDGNNVTIKNLKAALVAGAGTAGSRPNNIYSDGRTGGLFENLWLVGDTTVDDSSDIRQSGILFTTTTFSRVVNVTVEGTVRPAINLRTSTGNKVINNKISFSTSASNETGIWLSSSSDSVIDGNSIINYKDGMYSVSSDRNIISNNRLSTNVSQADGIMLVDGSDANAIKGNNIYSGSGVVLTSGGVYGENCLNNNITGNVITNASKRGIYLNGHNDGTAIVGNVISGNTASYSIDVTAADRVVVQDNIVRDNTSGLAAIYLANAGYSTISNNNVFSNSGDGIYITNGADEEPENVIIGNKITSNTGIGLVITGAGAIRNLVSNNSITGNTGGGIVDSGIDTRLSHNITSSTLSATSELHSGFYTVATTSVGIGTSTPRYILDVWGDFAVGTSTAGYISGTTTSTPAFYVDSGTGGRIGIGTTTLVGLLTVGTSTPALVVDPTGLVGIGTTTPLSRLSVSGDIVLGLTASTRYATGTTISSATSTFAGGFISLASSTIANYLSVGTSTTPALFVDSGTGNVGVATTTAPVFAFGVHGQCVTGDTRLRRRRRRKFKSQISSLKIDDYVYDEVIIKDVQPGDEIASLDENTGKIVYRKVNTLLDMGVKQTYKLITESGRSIRTTENHPYLTKEGWKKVQHLKAGQPIAVPKIRSARTYAFIDASNIIYGVRDNNWKMDFAKLFRYLKTRFGVEQVFYYGGSDSQNIKQIKFYERLQDMGYKLRLVPVKRFKNGERKGDIDSRMTFEMMKYFSEYDRAVVLTGDGDFYWALEHLLENKKELKVLSFASRTAKEIKELVGGEFSDLARIKSLVEFQENKKATDAFEGSAAGLMFSSYQNEENLSSSESVEKDIIWDTIVSIKKIAEEQVYDIEVEGTHNFIGNDIVAHNTYISATTTINSGLNVNSGQLYVQTGSSNVGIGTTAPTQKFQVNDSATAAFVVTSAGQVGIGTTTPLSRLSVSGDIVLGLAASTRYATGTTISSATSTFAGGFISLASSTIANYLSVGTSTTPDLFVDTGNGRVGIATTTPQYTLNIFGDLAVGTSTATSTTEIPPAFIVDSGNGPRVGIGTTTLSTNLLTIGTTTPALVIDQLNNTGFGTSTPSSQARLSVQGNIIGTGNIIIAGTATSTINHGLIVDTNTLYVMADTNNVGIGTTAPGYKLTVSGGAASITGGSLTVSAAGTATTTITTGATGSATSSFIGDISAIGVLSVGDGSATSTIRGGTSTSTINHGLIVDTSSLYVMADTNNVGIGTTTPQSKLSVSGDLVFGLAASTRYATGTTISSATSTFAGGFISLASSTIANYLSVGTSTTPDLFVDTGNGRVGIGTTGPAHKLSVQSVGATFQLGIGDDVATGLNLGYEQAGATNAYIYNVYTGSTASAIKFGFGDTPETNVVMTLQQDGNVGIGTKGPTSKLTVFSGNISVGGGTATTTITYGATGAATSTFAGDISAIGVLSVGDGSATSTIRGGTSTSTINHGLIVDTNTLYIMADTNNVGIGTTTPLSRLSVSGDIVLGLTASTRYATGTTISSATSTFAGGFISLASSTIANYLSVGTSTTPALFVDSGSGRVGVNTASPSYPLHVTGECVTGDTLLPIFQLEGKSEARSTKSETNSNDQNSNVLNCFENSNLEFNDCFEFRISNFEFKPIVDVEAGDYVLSLNEENQKIEPHRINGLLDKGIQPVFKLTTESGRSIRTTGNHPYFKSVETEFQPNETRFREAQWTKVSELKPGDEIAVPAVAFGEGWAVPNWETKNTEIDSVSSATSLQDYYIVNQNLLSTKNPTNNGEILEDSTSQRIRFATGAYIIANQITLSSDLNRDNQKAVDLEEVASSESRWQTGVSLLSRPTANSLYQSDVKWEEIISIDFVGEEQVYDIEVEGTHNFIGNDIVAHNTYISATTTINSGLNVNNGQLYVQTGSSNVGIGTTAPTQKFQVNDSATAAFVVTSAGQVGIGTTTPLSRLSVSGDLVFGLAASTRYATGTTISSATSTFAGGFISLASSTIANYLSVGTSTTPVLFVNSGTGNVGIGVTSPPHKLTVAAGNASITGGSLYVSAAGSATTTITTGATGSATSSFIGDISAIGVLSVGDGSATSTIRGASAATSTIISGFAAGNSAALVVNQAASANTLYIDPSSNVGIATSTPSAKFAVQGDILGVGNLILSGTITTGQGETELYLMNQNIRTSDAVTFSDIVSTYGISAATSTITATSTLASINADSGLFYVDSYTNNVGIGTIRPTSKLTVFSGNISVGGGTATTTITYGATGAATSTFAGDISAIGVLSVGDGSATSTIRGGTSTSTINHGLIVDTNTLYVMAETNRIGIGTSTPTFKLDVNGSVSDIYVEGALYQTHFTRIGPSANTAEVLRISNDTEESFDFGVGPFATWTKIKEIKLTSTLSSAVIKFDSRITDSGLGGYYVQLYKNGAALGASSAILNNTTYSTRSETFATLNATIGDLIQVYVKTVYTGELLPGYYIKVNNFQIYYDYDTNLTFGINNSEIMRITSSGSIGIGTTTPLSRLSVSGDIVLGLAASTRYATGTTISSATSTFAGGFISLASSTIANYLSVGTSTTPALFVDSGSGRVGVNTASPSYPLHVTGECVTGDTLLPIFQLEGKSEARSTKSETNSNDQNSNVLNCFENSNLEFNDCFEFRISNFEFKPIVDVEAGDYVLSLNEENQKIEPHRINGLLDKGIQPVFKLTTESGRSIRTTGNHPYFKSVETEFQPNETRFREAQWTKVSELKPGDEIAVPKFEFSSNSNKKTAVSGFSGDPTVVWNSGLPSYFDYSRSRDLVKSLVVADTGDNLKALEVAGFAPADSWMAIPSPHYVTPRANLLYQNFGNNQSEIFWDKIVSIDFVGEEQVYDIEVEGTHNFIGNDIVAHNTYISATTTINSGLNVNNGQLYVQTGSSNVGIGTTAPTQKFQVNDSATAAFVVTSAGQVGIGTTTPLSRLSVSGDIVLGLTASTRYATGTTISSATSTFAGGFISLASSTIANYLSVGTSTTPVLFVDSGSGNVGIGTTGPTNKLDVAGDIGIGANKLKTTDLILKENDAGSLIIRNAADTANLSLFLADLYPTGFVYLQSDATGLTAKAANNAYAVFKAQDNDVGLVEVARLQGAADPYFQAGSLTALYSGNVGIGTTGPGYKLTVSGGAASITGGSLYVSAAGSATTTITTGATGSATSTFAGDISAIGVLSVGDGSATSTLRGASAATSTINSGFTAGNNAALVINQAATANSLYINPSGNVGIGTTGPGQEFEVIGDVKADVFYPDTAIQDLGGQSYNKIYADASWGYYFQTANAAPDAFVTRLQIGRAADIANVAFMNSNVGIGSVSPGEKLTVHSGNIAVGGGTATTTIRYGATGAATSTFAGDISAIGVLSVGDGSATSTIRGGTSTSTINHGLIVDTSTLYVMADTNNVGIGTTTPLSRLSVSGDIVFGLAASTRYATGTTISSATSTFAGGFISLASSTIANYLSVGTSTTPDLFVDTGNGRIGIGTTSPSNSLDIYQGKLGLSIGDSYGIAVGNQNLLRFNGSTAGTLVMESVDYAATAYKNFSFMNGNVGIGTTGPGYKLTVSGGAASITGGSLYVSAAGSATTTITTGATGSATSSFIGDISAIGVLSVGDGSATSTLRGASAATSTINSGFTAGNNAALVVNQAATANSLYINPSGNVGIGTTGPGAKLDVAGTLSLTGDLTQSRAANGANAYIWSLNTGTGDAVAGYILGNDSNTQRADILYTGAGFTPTGLKLANQLYITVGSNSAGGIALVTPGTQPITLGTNNTSRLIINGGGNLGIGTTTPLSRLSVSGDLVFGLAASTRYATGTTISSATSTFAGGFISLASSTIANYLSVGTSTTPVLFVDSGSGNVGIGTTTPYTKLTVNESDILSFGSFNEKMIDDMEGSHLNWTSSDTTNVSTSSEQSIVKVGGQSLKITASGASEDDTVKQTFNSNQNWTNYERLGFWIYADRIATSSATTTQLMTFVVNDSGAGETATSTIYIQSEGKWQYQELTLSGTAADKDAVNYVYFRVDVNQVVINFYIDQIRVYDDSERAAEMFVGRDGALVVMGRGGVEIGRADGSNNKPGIKVDSAVVELNQPLSVNVGGDVGMSSDLQFLSTGLSQITSEGPLRISAGDSNHSENLTLTTGGTGDVIIELSASSSAFMVMHAWAASTTVPFIINSESNATTTAEMDKLGILFQVISDYSSDENTIFSIDASGNYYYDRGAHTPAADVAEKYLVEDQTIEAGDVVCLSENTSLTVEKCSQFYQNNLIGVISSRPALLMANDLESSRPVALAGRVPVKVSLENGPINIGDPLTSASSTPGVAIKATRAGKIFGYALEPFGSKSEILNPKSETNSNDQNSNSTNTDGFEFRASDFEFGTIMVFIHLDELGGDLTVAQNESGNLMVSTYTQAGQVQLFSVDETGALVVGKIKTQELCVGSVCVTEADFLRVFGASIGETILGSPTAQTSTTSQEVGLPDISSSTDSVCTNGANRPCGSEVGVCTIGVQVCEQGQWGECIGAVFPAEEICDGVDNDCDGESDENNICLPAEAPAGAEEGDGETDEGLSAPIVEEPIVETSTSTEPIATSTNP